jgi:signal transduction histidine kinase
MSDRIDISTAAGRGDPVIMPGLRRLLLVGVFALLIVATLYYGISAERLLAARSTRMAGPGSPVTGVLDQLDASLTALVKDDHRVAGRTTGTATAERLQPILDGFRAARVSWLRFSDADLGIDVLLSHQLERRLEEFEQLFGRVAGPLASSPEPLPETYARLQRMAAALSDLIDQTRRAYLTVSRAEHARDMREIHHATRIFVYLGALALAGFLAIGGLYLWQTRRYDRHIQALSELSALLSSKAGIPLFEGLVSFLGRELGHAYVFIGQLNPADPEQVDTLAVYAHGKLAGNISYRLPGTPCANVMQRNVCYYPSGVQQKFPQDRLLQEMGVDSYAGTPLLDSQDQPLGILVLLDSRPISPATLSSSLIQIIASRAQTELERLRVEALRSSTLDGLEARVEARTADLRRINDQLEAEVSARREMERELEQARNLAEHGNRAKGEFLANASHEIRTHINGLLGMLSLLEDGQMEGEQLEYVEMAHASGDVLLALINDLLDYSKIEAGQLRIETVDFELDHLLGELSDLFGMRARRRPGAPDRGRRATAAETPWRHRAHSPGAVEPARQRPQVHQRGARGAASLQRRRRRHRPPGTLRGRGYGDRVRSGQARPAVRPVRPGRRLHHPALRRHRARSGDLRTAGTAVGRGDRRRRRARSRHPLLVHHPVAAAAGTGRSRRRRDTRFPRGVARAGGRRQRGQPHLPAQPAAGLARRLRGGRQRVRSPGAVA